MLHRKSRYLPGGVAAVSILAGTFWLAASSAASAQASTAARPPAAVGVTHAAKLSSRAVLAYWTPARLRAAKPVDVVVAGARPHLGPATGRPTGKPGGVPGGPAAAAGLAAASPTAGGLSPNLFSLPFPHDTYIVPVFYEQRFPWTVNGRLFFINNGSNRWCSATSVASASGTKNENEIWTAGHCLVNILRTDRIVDSSAVFIPAYNGSSTNVAPFGEFAWTGAGETTTAWLNNSDYTEDEAAMTVGTSSTTGRTLGQAVGWDGFAWNQSVNQQFSAFGYPSASPYNGCCLFQDWAATAAQDTGIGGTNPVKPIGIGNGNSIIGGTIGGAWDIGWSLTSAGSINGHNDFTLSSQPGAVYSPYQDTLSNMVRCFGASSC
jgi:hypothetical protein